jgi:hypothetical protein
VVVDYNTDVHYIVVVDNFLYEIVPDFSTTNGLVDSETITVTSIPNWDATVVTARPAFPPDDEMSLTPLPLLSNSV